MILSANYANSDLTCGKQTRTAQTSDKSAGVSGL